MNGELESKHGISEVAIFLCLAFPLLALLKLFELSLDLVFFFMCLGFCKSNQ